MATTRILVVDDDQDFCKVVAATFRANEFEVYTAFNGESALRVYAENQPDVVLLDVGMPGMNGFEVAERIRSSEAGGKRSLIVIMTAHARTFDISQEFMQQIDSYLTKPILPDHILEQVINLL